MTHAIYHGIICIEVESNQPLKENTMTEKQIEEINNLYAKKEMMIQLFGGRGMDSLNEAIAKMEQDILNKKEI